MFDKQRDPTRYLGVMVPEFINIWSQFSCRSLTQIVFFIQSSPHFLKMFGSTKWRPGSRNVEIPLDIMEL